MLLTISKILVESHLADNNVGRNYVSKFMEIIGKGLLENSLRCIFYWLPLSFLSNSLELNPKHCTILLVILIKYYSHLWIC